jgi:hypothetical protein
MFVISKLILQIIVKNNSLILNNTINIRVNNQIGISGSSNPLQKGSKPPNFDFPSRIPLSSDTCSVV